MCMRLFIICVLLVVLLEGCGNKGDGSDSGLMHGYAETVGSSMEPLLEDGDVVLIIPIKFEQVEVGDVVAFQSMRGMVLHRVVERDEKRLWTKGDNNRDGDPWPVRKGDYLGLARL